MDPDIKIAERNMKIETSGHGKARRLEKPLRIVPGLVRLSSSIFLSLIFLSNPFSN
jgi:hypothetical protein